MKNNETYVDLFGDEHHKQSKFNDADCQWDHWDSMPAFEPKDTEYYLALEVEFGDTASVNEFVKKTGLPITDQTKTIWYPDSPFEKNKQRYYDVANSDRNFPQYPFYIISKGRWEVRPTSDSFVEMNIPHYIVVEASQVEQYKSRVDSKFVTVLTLDQKFLDEYDTFDDLGSTRSKGPGAARNFAWDHSIKLGAKRHWVFDDNQAGFFRHDGDRRLRCMSAAMFRAMEDHTDRYSNVVISGPNYRFLSVPKDAQPPFIMNTRIYSSLLIQNDIPYRWRGRYNEDTDLSLRVLKDGFCTVQYNSFTTGKMVTQAMTGGNTTEFYSKEGTMPKSKMIADMHPDVAKVVWMNKRWHHKVDYAPYRKNRLLLTKYVANPDHEYGMKLKDTI